MNGLPNEAPHLRPPGGASRYQSGRAMYETREAGLGLRFVGEVRESLRRIADSPLRFPIVDKDVHRALLHKFPYSIYFVNEPEAAAIIAVLHQHRRPATWKSRR